MSAIYELDFLWEELRMRIIDLARLRGDRALYGVPPVGPLYVDRAQIYNGSTRDVAYEMVSGWALERGLDLDAANTFAALFPGWAGTLNDLIAAAQSL